MSKLNARLIALEKQVSKSDWLILHCETEPTDEQLSQMEKAERTGQMALLFGQRYDTVWRLGYLKPWESD
jgi:hypothetical protein